VRLVDVVPTILELLTIPAPDGLDGTSLVPGIRGEGLPELPPAYCETFYWEELAESEEEWSHLLPLKALRRRTDKVVWENGGDSVEMYDLVRDGQERTPLRLSGGCPRIGM
jgi:arylsulfatase A-like enzyme